MIGIFDSGIGGLGVAKAIRQKAPKADLVYFGDLANMPYGPKSTDQLFRLTLRAMIFLRTQGATQYVSACNSVSVSVIVPLAAVLADQKTRVIEMVDPAARVLARHTIGSVVVAATQATVRSGMYERALGRYGLTVESVALAKLAGAIEQNADDATIAVLIKPAVDKAIACKASTLVFGCTQYPFVKDVFKNAFSQRNYPIQLFDPSEAVADTAVQMLDTDGEGLNTFFVSKSSAVFNRTVLELFGPSAKVHCVDVDKFVDNSVDEQWRTQALHTCVSVREC